MKPNPGSDEALDQGCTCAVLDNNHGRFAPWADDGWWITEGCPVHDPPRDPAEVVVEP
jgi:hypothetical protein